MGSDKRQHRLLFGHFPAARTEVRYVLLGLCWEVYQKGCIIVLAFQICLVEPCEDNSAVNLEYLVVIYSFGLSRPNSS